MERIGRLTLRTNDRCDVITLDVFEAGIELSDEGLVGIEDPQFDSSNAWITGRIPKFHPVDIEGDTITLRGFFRGDRHVSPYIIRLYVEYEEVEELLSNEIEHPEEESNDDCLEPQEIIL